MLFINPLLANLFTKAGIEMAKPTFKVINNPNAPTWIFANGQNHPVQSCLTSHTVSHPETNVTIIEGGKQVTPAVLDALVAAGCDSLPVLVSGHALLADIMVPMAMPDAVEFAPETLAAIDTSVAP